MTSLSHRSRGGSALLIVLGFLSFMVVSAIAFAVFMRAERAPSSALRRGTATRHLVKAALARAISDVDDAVRGDAFPRSSPARTKTDLDNWLQLMGQSNGYRDNRGNLMNFWYGRVFMPPDPEGATLPGDSTTRFAPIGDTVSVLNLEGLGYLPPGLVNDVRFLSRCSWAAKWKNFPYDAGRYAYTAVNVSDFFDINLLRANQGRNSSGNGLISLAPCFKNSSGTAIDPSVAGNFDRIVHDARISGDGASASMPYVSMLDYNLAIRDNNLGGGYNSPFWSWINKPSYKVFYQELNNTNENSNVARAKRQAFVTDSWFPTAAGNNDEKTNLVYEAAQPFSKSLIDQGWKAPIANILGESRPFIDRVVDNPLHGDSAFTQMDFLSLFDYMDRDDVPISLAIPCVERVPMAVALQPAVNGSLKVHVKKEQRDEPASHEKIPYDKITIFTATLQEVPNAALQSVYAFPFKRGKKINDSFNHQALLRLFFVVKGEGQDKVNVRLRNGNGSAIKAGGDDVNNILACLRPKQSEWSSANPLKLERGSKSAFVLTYLSSPNNFSMPDDVIEGDDAFADNGETDDVLRAQGSPQGKIFFVRTETQHYNAQGEPDGEKKVAWSFPDECRPINADGTSLLPDGEGDGYAGLALQPCLAIWTKVAKSGNDRAVVDYVPAVSADDRELRGVDTSKLLGMLPDEEVRTGDYKGTPLIASVYSEPVTFGKIFEQINTSLQAPTGEADVELVNFSGTSWAPRSHYAVDPRYNWAPEDWLASDKPADADQWLDSVKGTLEARGRSEKDIFFSVANQGYLQSMGELAMLPMLKGATPSFHGDGTLIGENKVLAHADYVWRNFPVGFENDDAKYKMFKLGIVSDGGGFRVNPYTDNTDILRAVVEATPYDWWAAGTNQTTTASDDNQKSVSEKKGILKSMNAALDYAFCENTQCAKLTSKAAGAIAARLGAAFGSAADWEAAYDALWMEDYNLGDDRKLFGVDLEGLVLHEVDRKYLYAFWHDCFANKQQLYLIFVRAESNALGGPGEGTPSQQGGRAVALVWRDPTLGSNIDNKDGTQNYDQERHPHRTRILFYHQFE